MNHYRTVLILVTVTLVGITALFFQAALSRANSTQASNKAVTGVLEQQPTNVYASNGSNDLSQPVPDGIYTNYTGLVELSLVQGKWLLKIGSKGLGEEGTYAIFGDQIKFNLVKRDAFDACDAVQTSFSYEWRWAGGSIMLTPLDDSCDIRTLGLAQGPLLQEGAEQVAPR